MTEEEQEKAAIRVAVECASEATVQEQSAGLALVSNPSSLFEQLSQASCRSVSGTDVTGPPAIGAHKLAITMKPPSPIRLINLSAH